MVEPMWQSIGKAYTLVNEGSVERIEGKSTGVTWEVTREGAVTSIKVKRVTA